MFRANEREILDTLAARIPIDTLDTICDQHVLCNYDNDGSTCWEIFEMGMNFTEEIGDDDKLFGIFSENIDHYDSTTPCVWLFIGKDEHAVYTRLLKAHEKAGK